MTRKFNKKIYAFLVLIMCLCAFIGTINITYCAETEDPYTNVLEDLQKDSSFNLEDYPIIELDYSLQVIQIAESKNNELYIYVYHPARQFKATSINIATAQNKNYKVYELDFINKYEALYKYKVSDFVVKNDLVRYYDISAIYRNYSKFVDSGVVDNEKSEVSYEVGKAYTATTIDGAVTYDCITTETVTITDKYVGFVRYGSSIPAVAFNNCDAHFVAFSTDKDIDLLMQAELYYVKKSYTTREHDFFGDSTNYGDAVKSYTTLSYLEDASVGHRINGIKYKWDRIQSASDFVNSDNYELKSSAKSNIKNKDWVLSFYESEYNMQYTPPLKTYTGTAVTDVTILRLKFATNGVVYDLGVVDDRQQGDLLQDNKGNSVGNWWDDLLDALKKIGMVLLAILLVPVLIPLIALIFKGLYYVLKYIILGIIWLVKAIINLFKGGD